MLVVCRGAQRRVGTDAAGELFQLLLEDDGRVLRNLPVLEEGDLPRSEPEGCGPHRRGRLLEGEVRWRLEATTKLPAGGGRSILPVLEGGLDRHATLRTRTSSRTMSCASIVLRRRNGTKEGRANAPPRDCRPECHPTRRAGRSRRDRRRDDSSATCTSAAMCRC